MRDGMTSSRLFTHMEGNALSHFSIVKEEKIFSE